MQEKKRILITGARGFIGRSIVESYRVSAADTYELFYPYHAELELTYSYAVRNYIKDKGIEIILHCASIGGTRKTDYDIHKTDVVAVNLLMFFNVVRCSDIVNKIIYFGSGAEYSKPHFLPLMKEDYFDIHVPIDPYGFSKYVCSKYAERADRITNLRLFGVFGKYEDHAIRFISNAILKNMYGLPIVINQNVNFDYLYVEDLVRLTSHFIDNKVTDKTFNMCTGSVIDLVSIAGIINEVGGNESDILIKNPGLNKEYSGDNTRLLKEQGNFKFTTMKDAIAELYTYFKANAGKYDRKILENDEYIKFCKIL
ncbi:MAG: NAD(P)-dependent oxidoreductase [Elusimicrobiota bacterium]